MGVSHILSEGDDAFLTGSKAETVMRRISRNDDGLGQK